jgi:DNA-binding HxlR family transcriptional regulator
MKELVKLGIVARTSYNEIAARVDYNLTQKGRDLHGVFKALNAWARKYNYVEQHLERMR